MKNSTNDKKILSDVILVLVTLTFLLGCEMPDDIDADPEILEQALAGGTRTRNYDHPWAVRLPARGCGGVLIHPEWILTAAHCVDGTHGSIKVGTTDPETGVSHQQNVQLNNHASKLGKYIHPEYEIIGFGRPRNDIALLRVRSLTLSRYIQTAALPDRPLQQRMRGTLVSRANHDGDGPLATGQVKALRMTVGHPDDCLATEEFACVSSPNGYMDEGDSGSGFYIMESMGSGFGSWYYDSPRRATVFGLASFMASNGDQMGASAGLTDVYYFKDWILDTIAESTGWTSTPKNELELEGNVTVKVSDVGIESPGQLRVTCVNLSGQDIDYTAPMDVRGAALSVYCQTGEHVHVRCGSSRGGISPHVVEDLTFESRGVERVEEGNGHFVQMIFRGGEADRHFDLTCNTEVRQQFYPGPIRLPKKKAKISQRYSRL